MPETRNRARLGPVLDQAATALGLVLLIAAAALGPIWAGLGGMRSDACTVDCRYDVIGVGSAIIAIGPAAALAAVVVVLLVRAPSGRPLSWVCGLGLAAAVCAGAIGDSVITTGPGR